jgi:hypothetical protein
MVGTASFARAAGTGIRSNISVLSAVFTAAMIHHTFSFLQYYTAPNASNPPVSE